MEVKHILFIKSSPPSLVFGVGVFVCLFWFLIVWGFFCICFSCFFIFEYSSYRSAKVDEVMEGKVI